MLKVYASKFGNYKLTKIPSRYEYDESKRVRNLIKGVKIEFENGSFETSDEEIQKFLDDHSNKNIDYVCVTELESKEITCPECQKEFKDIKALRGHVMLGHNFNVVKKPIRASLSDEETKDILRESQKESII